MLTKKKAKEQLSKAVRVIDRWLDYKVFIDEIPGLAVGIIHEDDVVFKGTYGFADIGKKRKITPSTCFHISSISKTFTAIALMQLVEQERLQLDDKASKHLAWFNSKNNKNLEKVTVRQLLSHSAGVIRDGDTEHWENDKFPSLKEIKRQVKDSEATVFDFTKQFKYSNFGFSILGEIVSAVAGQSYDDYITQNIITKLKLKKTSVDISSASKKLLAKGYGRKLPGKKREVFSQVSTNAMAPATGIVSNLNDLLVYMSAQLLDNKELVSEESKREMQRIQWVRNDDDIHYGLGYEIAKKNNRYLFGHGGGFQGYITCILIDPQEKIGVSILTNAIDTNVRLLVSGVYDAIYHFLNLADSRVNSKYRVKSAVKYEGRFASRWGDMDVVAIDDCLYSFSPHFSNPMQDFSPLEPVKKNIFRVTGGNDFDAIGETLHYEFNKSGKIKKVTFGGHPMTPFKQ